MYTVQVKLDKPQDFLTLRLGNARRGLAQTTRGSDRQGVYLSVSLS